MGLMMWDVMSSNWSRWRPGNGDLVIAIAFCGCMSRIDLYLNFYPCSRVEFEALRRSVQSNQSYSWQDFVEKTATVIL